MRSGTPEITVIIPCFNAAATLELQLEALATQLDYPPFEVVLVDNGSTDETADIVQRWAASSRLDIQPVTATAEQGASYARNVGIAHARADLLMFCDADDVVSQWWIAQGKTTFEVADFWSGSAILLTDAEFDQPLEGIRSAFGDSPEWLPPTFHQSSAFPVLMGGNFGSTRAVLTALGGFDQSLPSAGEDNDLAFRAQRAGVGVPVSPTVRLGYRGKWGLRDRCRLASRSAQAHALIATRYDAWSESPYPSWPSELFRCGGAGLKVALHRDDADWDGWRIRTATALGLARGALRYRTFGRLPPERTGLGLRPQPSSEGSRP